ncbi:MAG: BPSS1187 family protein [Inhella sp.]|uniref:BPSS1187 family protein n=1 Tax=Inhella sp. TaxID=1921806 RepID=UPI00391F369F
MRLVLRSFIGTWLLAWLTACGGGGGGTPATAPAPTPVPAPAPTPSVEREVLPSLTDAGIRTALEPHRVRAPSPGTTAKGRLLVFLPGTGATPALYRAILRVGADRGYHAIGLNYPNADAVGVLCLNSLDADCHGKVRNEVINGVDSSPLVTVTPTESLLNRLTQLLRWLNTQAPGEGWGGFLLPGGALDWSRITVAGHSQGGGHAAWLAQQFLVQRAVYFASPADWDSRNDRPAAWVLRGAMATPSARQWGIIHEDDPLVPVNTATRLWSALGLPGAPTRVDGLPAPWGGSQQLLTRLPPAPVVGNASPAYHGAPVADAATPVSADGTLLYAPVWIALAFPD